MQTNPPSMLGSEYNWLINLTYNFKGRPRVRLSASGLTTLFIAIFCFICVAVQAAQSPRFIDAHAPTKKSPTRAGVIQVAPQYSGPAVLVSPR